MNSCDQCLEFNLFACKLLNPGTSQEHDIDCDEKIVQYEWSIQSTRKSNEKTRRWRIMEVFAKAMSREH